MPPLPLPMDTPLRHGFRLGGLTVRPALLRVEGEGVDERLEPQIAAVLVLLAENAGRPVARAEFFARVWEGRAVSEDVLHRAVSRLRAVFRDDAASPRVIETIPRVGYRLLATPAPLDEPGRSWPSVLRRAALPTAVVLAGVAAVSDAPRGAGRGRPDPPRQQAAVALPGNELLPTFSPDGREVVFSWDGEDGRRRLYRMSADDAEPRRLTDAAGKEGASALAPDGRHVALARYEEGRCRVVRRSLADGAEEDLAPCHPSASVRLDFAPDGGTLVWSDVVDAARMRHAIRARDMGDGRVRWLTAPPEGFEDLHPATAPDGASVAFARGVPGSSAEVYRQPLDGGAAQRLTWAGSPVAGLDWIGPDSLVVATARSGDEHGLWQIDTSGGARPLDLGGDRRAPAVSPDGRRLVFESWRERSNLVRVALHGGAAVPIAPSSRRDHSPALAPGGGRLAFVSDRTGAPQVFTVRTDGTGIARLTSFADAVPARPSWSPDGTRVAFELRSGAHVRACVVAASGDEPRCFEDRGCARSPVFDGDGALLFGSDRDGDGRWRIWRRGLDGGEPRPVTARGDAPKGWADGALYYTEMRRDGLRRQTRDGTDELVLSEPAARLSSSVSIADGAIRYVREDGTVVRCGLDGAGCRPVGRVEGVHGGSALTIGGGVAYLARYRKTETDLLTLVDFARATAGSVASSEEPRSLYRRPPGL